MLRTREHVTYYSDAVESTGSTSTLDERYRSFDRLRMLIAEEEALACLKILAALAKADGTVKADERRSLEAAIASLQLPLGTTAEGLLAETIDVPSELAKVESAEAREQLYRSAHFLAYSDGSSATDERALLAQIEATTAPSEALRAQMASLVPAARSAGLLGSLRALFQSKS